MPTEFTRNGVPMSVAQAKGAAPMRVVVPDEPVVLPIDAKLYQIADVRQRIDAALDAAEGEITPDLESVFDATDAHFDKKAEHVALFVQEQHAIATSLRSHPVVLEAARLLARADAFEKRGNDVKAYLLAQMQRVQKTKIQGALVTIAVRQNNPAVVELVATTEEDFRDIAMYAPALVRRIPEQWSWNKDEVKRAHEAGTLPEPVATRVTVKRGVRVEIK